MLASELPGRWVVQADGMAGASPPRRRERILLFHFRRALFVLGPVVKGLWIRGEPPLPQAATMLLVLERRVFETVEEQCERVFATRA